MQNNKEFNQVLQELESNFGWENINELSDEYKNLINDTIKAVKNLGFYTISTYLPLPELTECERCGNIFEVNEFGECPFCGKKL